MIIDTLNALCGPGFFPGLRLSEGRLYDQSRSLAARLESARLGRRRGACPLYVPLSADPGALRARSCPPPPRGAARPPRRPSTRAHLGLAPSASSGRGAAAPFPCTAVTAVAPRPSAARAASSSSLLTAALLGTVVCLAEALPCGVASVEPLSVAARPSGEAIEKG